MLKEKIKDLVASKTTENNKKTVENLVVFLVLLILTVLSIKLIWGKDSDNKNPAQDEYKVLAESTDSGNISQNEAYNLENRLEDILSKISGTGKVQVLITYSETSEVVAMHNEAKNISKTEENDSNRRNKSNRNNR